MDSGNGHWIGTTVNKQYYVIPMNIMTTILNNDSICIFNTL